MTDFVPTFAPGSTFQFRKSTWIVDSSWIDKYHGEMVSARRFIKSTQKYSGNAYCIVVSDILTNAR